MVIIMEDVDRLVLSAFFCLILTVITLVMMNANDNHKALMGQLKNIETAVSQYHDLELQLDIKLNQEEDLRL